jgi:hypothetical protein
MAPGRDYHAAVAALNVTIMNEFLLCEDINYAEREGGGMRTLIALSAPDCLTASNSNLPS